MIGVDSSTLVAYFQGEKAKDTDLLHDIMLAGKAAIAPVVLTELFSGPNVTAAQRQMIEQIDVFDIDETYWVRAGLNRRLIASKHRKAKLGDALIAQCCIDHDAPLLTRDGDFAPYVKHCGLKLA